MSKNNLQRDLEEHFLNTIMKFRHRQIKNSNHITL